MAKKQTTKKTSSETPIISFGAFPSPYDYRDIPIAAVSPVATAYPASHFVDVTALPVWYQRKIGACVGHAAAKYKQKLDHLETGTIIALSARFLYALAKCRDKYAGEGTYPRLVAQILKDHGCATEATVPNDTNLDHESYVYGRAEARIPAAAWKDAEPFKIGGYAFANVKDAGELKSAIINHSGAMLLMRLGEEWWKKSNGVSSWLAKDIVPLRAPKSIVGGHEVYLYGYEDVIENGKTRTKFYIFNSWSADWGDKGTAYFYHDEYSPWLDEAITLVDVPNEIKDQLKKLPTKEDFRFNFKKELKKGQTNADVTALQTALMIDGTFSRDLFATLLKDNALGYYGTTTAKALYDYQVKYKVAPLVELNSLKGGVCGPKTRAHLNNWTNK